MAASNCTRGSYAESGEAMMRCYDLLPAAVREVMRNSIHQWATGPRLSMLRNGYPASDLIEYLVHRDVALARRDAKFDWPDQAADYLAAQRPRRRRDWLDKPVNSRL
jgi:hypothetical protein